MSSVAYGDIVAAESRVVESMNELEDLPSDAVIHELEMAVSSNLRRI